MSDWKVTWWDGGRLRETLVLSCDAYNLISMAQNMGVMTYGIIKMERIGTP